MDILNYVDPMDDTLSKFLRDFTDRIKNLEEEEIREFGENIEGRMHLCENIPTKQDEIATKASKLLKNPQISKNKRNYF